MLRGKCVDTKLIIAIQTRPLRRREFPLATGQSVTQLDTNDVPMIDELPHISHFQQDGMTPATQSSALQCGQAPA